MYEEGEMSQYAEVYRSEEGSDRPQNIPPEISRDVSRMQALALATIDYRCENRKYVGELRGDIGVNR